MRILYLITARKGSKGLPGKNTKLLMGKPLIEYTINFALENITSNDVLCISTNDPNVILLSEKLGVYIPFIRPEELSMDTSSSYDVIMHALNYFEKQGEIFDAVLLLQPTSPIRRQLDLKKLINEFDLNIDMVVSVEISKENPYFTLYEENTEGYLFKSKAGLFTRRQDCPEIYALNGSFFLLNVLSLKKQNLIQFNKIKKIIIPKKYSSDIDSQEDWDYLEYRLKTMRID